MTIFESIFTTFEESVIFEAAGEVVKISASITNFNQLKFVHFIENTTVFICYKHSSLTAQTGKQRKTKFGRINSWDQLKFVQIRDTHCRYYFKSRNRKTNVWDGWKNYFTPFQPFLFKVHCLIVQFCGNTFLREN